jgi:hypothetical protein
MPSGFAAQDEAAAQELIRAAPKLGNNWENTVYRGEADRWQ